MRHTSSRTSASARAATLVALATLGLAACSRGDDHAQQACKDADFYRHGVCMWGVSCTEAGDADIGNDAIDEAVASSTTELHDAVTRATSFDAKIGALYAWCRTT